MSGVDEAPAASTSFQSRPLDGAADHMEDDALPLRDDEGEIKRLELPATLAAPSSADTDAKPTTTADAVAVDDANDERIARISFTCHNCEMAEMVHFYGRSAPFVYGVEFVEDTFVLRDPFQAPPPRWKPHAEFFVALGAKCAACGNNVCRDVECSFFYTRTYCLACAQHEMAQFPVEAQSRLRKQLAAV